MKKDIIKKEKNHAFGKDIFLLGHDEYGKRYWLEAPRWDCGWYWGFGYVETYTNNRHPGKSKDFSSHQHIDSSFMGKINGSSEYVHNIYDCPKLTKTTFTYDEGWKLSELFKQFYLLKDMAAFTHKKRPGCHTTKSPVDHGDMKSWCDHINDVMIPKITAEIMSILSPNDDTKRN